MCKVLNKNTEQSFLKLYNEYGIRSTPLLKSLYGVYSKYEKQYSGFKDFLTQISLGDHQQLRDIVNFSVRNQDKNHAAVCTAAALVKIFEDIKPFNYQSLFSGQFDLEKSYGINPLPLFNHFPQNISLRYTKYFFPDGINAATFSQFFTRIRECIIHIKHEKLLGKNTNGHLTYLKFWADIKINNLEEINFEKNYEGTFTLLRLNEVLRKTISLLADRLVKPGYPIDKIEKIKTQLEEIIILYIKCNILVLYERYPQIKGYNMFISVLSDEIISVIREIYSELNKKYPHLKELISNCLGQIDSDYLQHKDGFETQYCPYNYDYIKSGDYFGDCTASVVKKQVDPNTANIHWTVYSWLLNPYYRIIEVYYSQEGNKEKLLKGHILPLIIHNKKVLMIDAIEVVPKLRQFVRGRENEYFDHQLFDKVSDSLLDTLFEKCEELGEMMGVEAIYIEMFSNAQWVNRLLSQMPNDSYNIFKDICIPFGTEVVEKNIELIQNYNPKDVTFEVQAVNCNLMEQYTKSNYKEIAVLKGRRKCWNLHIRGI